MTPAARYAAAIGVLDGFLAGAPAEKLLSNWARGNRYAGSKDRAAVRDIVFDCLRCLRSYQGRAGFTGGRGLAVGHLLAHDLDLAQFFTGEGYAPPVLDVAEIDAIAQNAPLSDAALLDLPDWLLAPVQSALGEEATAYCRALQARAPVDLRVNLTKTTRQSAQAALAKDGIVTAPVESVATALRVSENPRRVAQSAAYLAGAVELQDAASQAVVAALPLQNVKRVLDYCAGGGGKTLAMAALAPKATLVAHDASPARLAPLADRAKRAGARVQLLKKSPKDTDRFDLVLLDVPCSGSGSWRRNPEGKWRFEPHDLAELQHVQAGILQKTAGLVAENGVLAYVTCSVLRAENQDQIDHFCAENPDWRLKSHRNFAVGNIGDGFFLAILERY